MRRTGRFSNIDQAAYYLGAMIDGEGCVKNKAIVISNTDEDIIQAILDACAYLDIKTGRSAPVLKGSYKPLTIISISSRANLEKTYRRVPIMSVKRERLKAELDSYKTPSDDAIVEAYVVQGLSTREVGELLGCSYGTVRDRLRKLGLIRDKRQAAMLNTMAKELR